MNSIKNRGKKKTNSMQPTKSLKLKKQKERKAKKTKSHPGLAIQM